jgi:RNA polymerase sigma-70 factor (ECF subfamily)
MNFPPAQDPFTTRETLFLRIKPGAPERELAWREFYAIYGPILGGFARNLGAPPQDIPDIIQEVLLGFFGASPSFVYNPERGRFRGYLKTCTWRVFQRKFRGRIHVAGLPVDEVADSEPSVEETWNDAWEQEQLRRAMEDVRQRYSLRPEAARTFQAFEMYALLEQPAESIAAQLEISVNSVHQAKSRVSRAIKIALEGLNETIG